MNPLIVIPALDAEATLGAVVTGAVGHGPVLVVDDGSSDGTFGVAETAGALVVKHLVNRGKGAALRTGLLWAQNHGHDVIVTLDADGQHPAREIEKLLAPGLPEDALVLGARDLLRAHAPSANRISNGISNFFLRRITRLDLLDTQCGLRRYPVEGTLRLGAKEDGFGFEAEVIIRAAAAGMTIVQCPIEVLYPTDRTSHFDSWRDAFRIVVRVIATTAETRNPFRSRAKSRVSRSLVG